MTRLDVYRDLKGRETAIAALDAAEQQLVTEFRQHAATQPEWHDFDNYWLKAVRGLYEPRGLSGKEIVRTPVYRIAQDLSSRIALAAGLVRLPDYRDQLAAIARERFKTRREFCDAVGLSEDMFSHLCAGRKHLSMETLTQVLQRLGCTLRIVSLEELGVVTNGAAANGTAAQPLASASK